jgi:hypothetical protein
MTERIATCSCGQLRATCTGAPVRISVCHCLACQKRTGSVFGAQARFEESNVVVDGPSSEHARVGDAGTRVVFRFCPSCGSTVLWRLDALPGFVAVALGAFADPQFPAPTVSIYEARKHAWALSAALEAEHLD